MTLEQWEITSLAIIISTALIYVAFERIMPYNKGQKLFREGFIDDFFWYTIVQSYILGLIIANVIQWIDTQSGLSRLGLVSDWPIWVQLVFFVVTHDIYIYFFHRLQHRSKYLWRIHEAHHSVKDCDWVAGSRSHFLEILINQTIEFLPIILLGANPIVAVLKGTVSAVWGMFIHSNIDVKMGRLQYIFNGPEMHRWHHANIEEAYDKNFGTKFAIWDWVFGTAFFPDRETRKAHSYGVSDQNFPKHYFGQTIYAFRRFEEE